jgi:hypothetical protein
VRLYFLFDSFTNLFWLSRLRLLVTYIIVFRGRAAKLLFFAPQQLFFPVQYVLNILFTHFVKLLLLLFITELKSLVIQFRFFEIRTLVNSHWVEGTFGDLFMFTGLMHCLVLHTNERCKNLKVWYYLCKISILSILYQFICSNLSTNL